MPKQSFTRTLLKGLKSLSKSFNIHTLDGILGIGSEDAPEEEQIVELKVYRSEDESLSATESPEVAATKQKFADAVVEDEESEVSRKLRECCDGFGREKLEMLRQSAAFLLKLGERYRNYATNGKGIQQKLNFIKSAALIVGAMVRYKQIKNEEGLETSKCEIRKLQDEIQMVASLRKGFNVLEISQDLKHVLEECRVEVFEKFNDVFSTHDENKGKVRRERLEEAYEMSTKHYLDIMRKTAEECQDIMGKPPCKFTIVGLGSLARKETTLYSDFQHAIILEDCVNESPSFDEVMEYFRWYTTIFQIIIIGFGETSITNVDVKSLNDLYSENQSKKWFSDEHTPYGICFDSMLPNACKIPLGRQEPTKNRKHTIELIQPVSQMANLLTREEDIRNGYHLSEILSKTIFVAGDLEVYDCYLKAFHHMRSQQTEKTFLVHQLQQLLFPNITASHPWFLYAVQERLTSLLSCLANLFHVRSQSGFEIVHEFLDNGAIDHYMYYELMDAVAVALEIKTKIDHLILSHKARNFSHVHVTNLVGEERVASCYKTVMQYTVLLQHQLLELLREDSILKMQLFPAETYWEENKVITTRLLGIQVFWKELDFGLGRTKAIDKYEKHAEISSAEAKFVMRMASVALSTVFEYTAVFFQGPAPLYECEAYYIFRLQILLPDKFESHCIFFLQFLKGDIQALIYYYQLMFLTHYNQRNFQQAYEDYEDYEKCQELCSGKQNQSTYGSNHWMDLDTFEIKVINEVKVTDDMLQRIRQQIATEANYPRRLVLTVQYCVALLKLGQKEEANKNLLMLRNHAGKKRERFNQLMKIMLETDCYGDAMLVSHMVLLIIRETTIELSNFLSKGNISGMKLEIFEQRSIQRMLATYIQLKLTEARSLQYYYYTTPIFETLRLAADCFVSDRRKSSHLLWKILHSPSVTKPMMLDSVLIFFCHVWHGLSSQAVDDKIMDIDTIPQEHGTVTVPLLDKGSTSIQASTPQVEYVSSTSLHQEERPEGTSYNEEISNIQEHPDVDSSTEENIADVSSTGQLEANPESTKISAVGDDEQVAMETGAISGGFPSNEALQLDFQYSQLDADGEIGPEGGALAVDECSLTVPPKSLADTRNLGISMSMNFKNLGLPADKVPISPYLDIKFCGKLGIPAIARVPTWFMPSEDSEHGIKIYKRYRDEENKFTWRELPNEVKVHDGIIEFEVDHFCGFIAMIEKVFYWVRGQIRLKHGLFQLNQNFLSVICYRSPKSLFRQNVAELKEDGYKRINRNLFVMNTNQDLSVKMECREAHLHFAPQQYLLPATDLNPTTHLTFVLRLIEPKVEAEIRYLVNNFPAALVVELPPLKDLQREGQRAPDHIGTGSSAQTTLPAGNAPINLDRCTVNPPENPDVDSSTEEIIADLSSTTGQISAVGDDEQVAVETATSAVGIHIHLAGDGAILNISDVRVHAGDKGGDSTVINAPVGQLTTGNANTTNQGAGNNFVAGNITHEGPISAMKMAYKGGILTTSEYDTRNTLSVQRPSGDTSTEGPGTTERDTDSAGQSQQAGPSS